MEFSRILKAFIPVSYKSNLIFTLLFRAFKLCSNFELFHPEILDLKDVFDRNDYPCNFIGVCIKRFLNNIFIDKKELVCVLPFIGKKSLQLRSKLAKSVQNNLNFCHLKIVFQSPYKLRTLFRFKDTLDKKIRLILFIVIRVVAAILLIMVKLTDTFSSELQNVGVFQI